MRFQYAPPERLDIVADGRSLAVRDQKLGTQDLYFIGQTPLKFLLADHVDIAHDTQIQNISSDPNAVAITIFDKATFGGSATITLMFDPTTFALKQWTVLDSQGLQTVVTLFNVDLSATPDASLFKIDERQQMMNSRR
jgi:outer membrane lipoprotein-sorting protein